MSSTQMTPRKVAAFLTLLPQNQARQVLNLIATNGAEVNRELNSLSDSDEEAIPVLHMYQHVSEKEAPHYMLGWSSIVYASLVSHEWNKEEYVRLLTTAFRLPAAQASRIADAVEMPDDEGVTKAILRYAQKAADLLLGGLYDENTTKADLDLHGECILLGRELSDIIMLRSMRAAPRSLLTAATLGGTAGSWLAANEAAEIGDPSYTPSKLELDQLRTLLAVATSEGDHEGGWYSRAKKRLKKVAKSAVSSAVKSTAALAANPLASAALGVVPGGSAAAAVLNHPAVRHAIKRSVGDPSDPETQELAASVANQVDAVAAVVPEVKAVGPRAALGAQPASYPRAPLGRF